MKIILLEDDIVISNNITTILTAARYAVTQVYSLDEAIENITPNEYDAAIIDRGLPDGDGLQLVSYMRQNALHIPVLILTAHGQKESTIEGLDSGADDYLTKPFDSDVLLARLRALLRRSTGPLNNPVIVCGELTLNTNTHQVVVKGKPVELSPREYSLLEYLAYHPDHALTRLELLSHVWDDEIDLFSNTIDVHIRFLRSKLGAAGTQIHTVRGKGYMLCSQ